MHRVRVCVCSVMSDCDPCRLPGSSVLSKEYWTGVPFPPPRDLPHPGIEHASLASPAPAGGFFTTEPPKKHWESAKEAKYSRKLGRRSGNIVKEVRQTFLKKVTFSLKTWRKQESLPRALAGGIASQAAGTDMVLWSVPACSRGID